MGVSKNKGTPKSSILIGFSNKPSILGETPIFGNTHIRHGVLRHCQSLAVLSQPFFFQLSSDSSDTTSDMNHKILVA